MMFNAKESEEFFTEGIAELSPPVRNNPPRATIPREHEVQFLGYSGSLFVWNWNHFSPLAEIILNTQNVFVTSAFGHLHEIY